MSSQEIACRVCQSSNLVDIGERTFLCKDCRGVQFGMSNMTISEMFSRAKMLWNKACAHDEVDPKSSFIVFSEDNPHVGENQLLMARIQRVLNSAHAIDKAAELVTEEVKAIKELAK